MLWLMLADSIVVIHLAFVAFVVAGGLLVLRWHRLAWLHVPAAVWGALTEFMQIVCPLTDLENHFRTLAGASGYHGDFVSHYLLPILYPAGLTAGTQFILGMLVVTINIGIYGWLIGSARRH